MKPLYIKGIWLLVLTQKPISMVLAIVGGVDFTTGEREKDG
jgi:hypothetical protein